MDNNRKREAVRERYGEIAKNAGCGCGCGPTGVDAENFARAIGYSQEELESIPKESNLGLSCGNPTAIASLREGDKVLDLGSGAGFDCFLAASKVGNAGKIIGVDMTPEMIDKARENAQKSKVENVEFRFGEIENLPVEDNSVDVVISNCVINLSVDKKKVFQEIFRVLKPGGRIAISDIALTRELPMEIRDDLEAYVGCVGGAVLLDEYREILNCSGLSNIEITANKIDGADADSCCGPESDNCEENPLKGVVVSIYVRANK